jgi:hypothetical protein
MSAFGVSVTIIHSGGTLSEAAKLSALTKSSGDGAPPKGRCGGMGRVPEELEYVLIHSQDPVLKLR